MKDPTLRADLIRFLERVKPLVGSDIQEWIINLLTRLQAEPAERIP